MSTFFFFLPFSSSSSPLLLHYFIPKIKRELRGVSMGLIFFLSIYEKGLLLQLCTLEKYEILQFLFH